MCKDIPLLTADDIECRVQSVKESYGKIKAVIIA